jgi:hypothetical protein
MKTKDEGRRTNGVQICFVLRLLSFAGKNKPGEFDNVLYDRETRRPYPTDPRRRDPRQRGRLWRADLPGARLG